jgi:hypothetical protein
MEMRFYWVKERVEQYQFNVGWAPGDTNMGDYYTKHHCPLHHKCMRPYYLHDKHSPMIRNDTRLAILRGCVDIFPSSQPDQALSDKLLPLPYPPVHARTNARTNPSTQRATQLRSVLARVYAVSIQNQITTTVP